MKTDSKKMEMADKMYKQNSAGLGKSPKDYGNGKNTKPHESMKFSMNGKGTRNEKAQKAPMSHTAGNFEAKYDMASKSGMKGGYKQANC